MVDPQRPEQETRRSSKTTSHSKSNSSVKKGRDSTSFQSKNGSIRGTTGGVKNGGKSKNRGSIDTGKSTLAPEKNRNSKSRDKLSEQKKSNGPERRSSMFEGCGTFPRPCNGMATCWHDCCGNLWNTWNPPKCNYQMNYCKPEKDKHYRDWVKCCRSLSACRFRHPFPHYCGMWPCCGERSSDDSDSDSDDGKRRNRKSKKKSRYSRDDSDSLDSDSSSQRRSKSSRRKERNGSKRTLKSSKASKKTMGDYSDGSYDGGSPSGIQSETTEKEENAFSKNW